MPIVRIALRSGKSTEYRKAIVDTVHECMVKALNVSPLDRFPIITEHGSAELIYDAEYLGIHRTDDIVIIQITLNHGRTLEMKKAFFSTVAEALRAIRVCGLKTCLSTSSKSRKRTGPSAMASPNTRPHWMVRIGGAPR